LRSVRDGESFEEAIDPVMPTKRLLTVSTIRRLSTGDGILAVRSGFSSEIGLRWLGLIGFF
jgi:hypothetical protein